MATMMRAHTYSACSYGCCRSYTRQDRQRHRLDSMERARDTRAVQHEIEEQLDLNPKVCPKCGSPNCFFATSDARLEYEEELYYLGVEVPYTTETGDPSVVEAMHRELFAQISDI